MHDVLSDWTRRAVLYYLQEYGDPAEVEDVAVHLLAWWRGREKPASDGHDVDRRTRQCLLQEHLLKMDEFGVLAYDAGSDAVRLVEGMEVVVDPPWRCEPPEAAY